MALRVEMSENQAIYKHLPQLVKVYLVLRVRELDSSTPHINFIKSDLANFQLFLPLLSTTLLLLILVSSKTLADMKLVFNIKVSKVAILLKP